MKKNSHGPVTYIDPTTGLPKCKPNDCKDKFKTYVEVIETNYKWVGGPVKHNFHYSICDQCGTRTITSKDKKLTNDSYKRGTENQGIDPKLEELNNGS
jgi:hypothetical protein